MKAEQQLISTSEGRVGEIEAPVNDTGVGGEEEPELTASEC